MLSLPVADDRESVNPIGPKAVAVIKLPQHPPPSLMPAVHEPIDPGLPPKPVPLLPQRDPSGVLINEIVDDLRRLQVFREIHREILAKERAAASMLF